jgi:hypothetical protein
VKANSNRAIVTSSLHHCNIERPESESFCEKQMTKDEDGMVFEYAIIVDDGH